MASIATITTQSRLNALHLWHLTSLDAPTVAALWTWFIARSAHAPLPTVVPAAMFLAVWLLYAGDRLLDARRSTPADLEPRHLFHHDHRRIFALAMLLATALLIPLLLHLSALSRSAFHLDLLLAAALAAWFAVIHLLNRDPHQSAPKELMPALFFPAAVFLPTLVRAAETLRPWLLCAAISFGLICWLNCLLIFHWEHPTQSSAHITTRIALRHLQTLTLTCIVLPLILAFLAPRSVDPPLLATSLAAIGLLLLERRHHTLAPTTLRAAADLALLTPLLVVPFLQ